MACAGSAASPGPHLWVRAGRAATEAAKGPSAPGCSRSFAARCAAPPRAAPNLKCGLALVHLRSHAAAPAGNTCLYSSFGRAHYGVEQDTPERGSTKRYRRRTPVATEPGQLPRLSTLGPATSRRTQGIKTLSSNPRCTTPATVEPAAKLAKPLACMRRPSRPLPLAPARRPIPYGSSVGDLTGNKSTLPVTRFGINWVAKLLKEIKYLVGMVSPECPPGSVRAEEA